MALYSERATTLFRLVLALIAVVALGAPALLMAYQRTPIGTDRTIPVQQPVEFDHRHHVNDDGIDCLYCHYEAERSPHAGIPPAALCMGCHGQIWRDSPLLEPVRKSLYEGSAIAWRRVYRLPDFVYFDHSAHLVAGIGCNDCHGGVETMGRVFRVEPLTMGWCLDCHRAPPVAGVQPPEHCSGCHR
jgi:hypothetical protein